MVKTPGLYIHLASLRDYVNPVRADLVVLADEPGELELVTKPYAEDGASTASSGSGRTSSIGE